MPGISSAVELEQPGYFVQLGRPPHRVDLLNTLGSVDFATAYARRVEETIEAGAGAVAFPIIGFDDLIQAKRDAGRHKDLADIEYLTKE